MGGPGEEPEKQPLLLMPPLHHVLGPVWPQKVSEFTSKSASNCLLQGHSPSPVPETCEINPEDPSSPPIPSLQLRKEPQSHSGTTAVSGALLPPCPVLRLPLTCLHHFSIQHHLTMLAGKVIRGQLHVPRLCRATRRQTNGTPSPVLTLHPSSRPGLSLSPRKSQGKV